MDNAGLRKALFERMRVGVVVWHVAELDAGAATLVAANPAASTLTGLDFTAWLGASLRERCPAAVAAGRHEVYAEVARSDGQQAFEAAQWTSIGARAGWAGTIKRKNANATYRIGYTGWSSSWDEDVTALRLRPH